MRKKLDNRIRVMIENGVASNLRSMFVIVGDHGRDQVGSWTSQASTPTQNGTGPIVLTSITRI